MTNLLGTGGLVRAYQGAVMCALEKRLHCGTDSVFGTGHTCRLWDMSKVEHYISQHSEVRPEGSEYSVKVKMMMLVRREWLDEVDTDCLDAGYKLDTLVAYSEVVD